MVDDIVVVGASAGGVEALRALAGSFPDDLPAAVVVVLHIPRRAPSALPAILARAGALPAVAAEHGVELRAGMIYVAPADRHVLVADGHLHLSPGPSENGHRPAIDPLFRSAAAEFGPRAIGVVLSGSRDDGSAGLVAIAGRGGRAMVQEPTDAVYPAMPTNALEHVPAAARHAADKLGVVIAEQLREGPPRGWPGEVDERLLGETRISAMTTAPDATVRLAGAQPSGLSCPSCDGVLFELPGEPSPRFRCRIGHAWSPDSLTTEQATTAEDALWAALRALEEQAALLHRLGDAAEQRGSHRSAASLQRRAAEGDANAVRVRAIIVSTFTDPPDEPR
jgi:two-component system chemotaxis response regulator CheB